MSLSPSDIIEAIVDELVTGELGHDMNEVAVERTGPGSLLLDYGSQGRFTLTVTPEVVDG